MDPWKLQSKLRVKQAKRTFSDHRDANGHAHELAFGPHVRVDTHLPFLAFCIEARDRGMMGNLFSHKANIVAV